MKRCDETRPGYACGDEQSARGDRRGDGRSAGPDRLLAQHQGAPRFFVRAVRRRRRTGRAGRPYPGPSRLDAAFRARRDRTAGAWPRRRRRGQRSVRRRNASAGPHPGRADFPWQRAPPVRVRRQPRPSRRYRRDGAGLDGALYRDLPGGLSPAAGPSHARGRAGARRAGAVLRQHASARGARGRPARANRGAQRRRRAAARAGGGERAGAGSRGDGGAQGLRGPPDARDASPFAAGSVPRGRLP